MVDYKKAASVTWLVLAGLILGLSLQVQPAHYLRRTKHQGPVRATLRVGLQGQWFVRPNNQVFFMNFDNYPEGMAGGTFDDLSYTDVNGWTEHLEGLKLQEKK